MDTHQRYRLLVLGSDHVGKTCLIRRYLHNTFNEKYKETVEDIYPRDFHIGGCTLPLDIYDTNFYYPDMRRVSIASTDSFMLIFAVDNVNSFKNATELFKEIMDRRPTDYEDVPIVLIGNKNDVHDKKLYRETVQVWLNHLPTSKKSIPYFETSAKTGENTVDAFKSLLEQSGFPKTTRQDHRLNHQSRSIGLPNSPSHGRQKPPPATRQMSQQINIRCLSAGRHSHDSSDEDIDDHRDRSKSDLERSKGEYDGQSKKNDHDQSKADHQDRSKADHHDHSKNDHSNQPKIDHHYDSDDHNHVDDEKPRSRSINEKRLSRFARKLSMKKEKFSPGSQPDGQLINTEETDQKKSIDKKRGVLTRHGSLMKKPDRPRLSLKMKKSTIEEPDESDCKIS